MDKFSFTRALAKYVVNPITKLGAGYVPGSALLETKGRKSGQPRRNPVGYHLEGNTVWIVSEHGERADYVKNLSANPQVKLKIKGEWRNGTATPVPDADPRMHLRKQSNKVSAATVRLVGTSPVVVRIDLNRV